ncbi:MAG: hypothetical protein ACHQVK_01370 [Candidatus Paceibacterales bacterium]
MENQEIKKTNPPTAHRADKETLHILKLIIVAVLCFVTLVFVFSAGIFVGQKRAEFSFKFAENYHRNFGGPRMGIFSNFPNEDFMNSHGVFGAVLSINGNTLVVKGQSDVEQMIIVSSKTFLMKGAVKISLADIHINDTVVVIGSPDATGKIQAELIRVLPSNATTSIYIINNHIKMATPLFN